MYTFWNVTFAVINCFFIKYLEQKTDRWDQICQIINGKGWNLKKIPTKDERGQKYYRVKYEVSVKSSWNFYFLKCIRNSIRNHQKYDE